ncbi:MAG: TetR/AcrR family transcriptional regulator [Christensenella sp.]|nr:TetR/AcrR family transcriptional regulator [Christensenella sp.]
MERNNYDIQDFLQDYTESSPDKEIRIINAAINIFSEKGFEATRTREIAERAGVAEGTIFRYFPTKNAILERMVPLLIRVMLPRFSGPIEKILSSHTSDPVEEIWKEILIDRIQMIQDNGRFIRSVLPELIHRAPLLNQMKSTILPVIEQYVSKVVDYGKARGELDEALDAKLVLRQMLGFILTYSMFGAGDKTDMEQAVQEYLTYAMRGWRGTCKP